MIDFKGIQSRNFCLAMNFARITRQFAKLKDICWNQDYQIEQNFIDIFTTMLRLLLCRFNDIDVSVFFHVTFHAVFYHLSTISAYFTMRFPANVAHSFIPGFEDERAWINYGKKAFRDRRNQPFSWRIARARRACDSQIKRKESKIRAVRPLWKDWRLSEDKLHFFSE